jgi:hypothetical protein
LAGGGPGSGRLRGRGGAACGGATRGSDGRATRRRHEQRVAVATVRAEMRDRSNGGMKNLTHVQRREEKETHPFLDPAYIHRLTAEYRRARTVWPMPPYIH